jgi:hypothetical protein
MIESMPRFLQGIFTFSGQGYDSPMPISDALSYDVPASKRSQLIYFRGGNSSAEMVDIVLLRDGKVMRHFPVGAKGAVHVPLAVVEDLEPEQKLTLSVAAPAGLTGTLVIDVGLIEI